MGSARPASNLHHRSVHSGGAARRTDAGLAAAGGSHLLLDRAADCGGRDAGGSFLHLVQNAKAIGRGDGTSGFGSEEVCRGARSHKSNRSRSSVESNFCRSRCRIPAMIGLYYYFIGGAGNLSNSQVITASVVAALVMIVLGFFFAAVSGNLVGLIGSSNNPVSGLTLCTLVIAALLMVALGVSGTGGVAAVLGVAAVVCVSSAVAGEMLQDLKVGHILGGTPSKMQIGDLFGIVVASLVLFFPVAILAKAYTFGSPALPAPQAGLMAM